MPNPEVVNPAKFTVDTVLFNHDDFSVVYGTWNPTNTKSIAMRWNDAGDGNGYPKVFGNPQWFLVSSDLTKSILVGLLTNPLITDIEEQMIKNVLIKI